MSKLNLKFELFNSNSGAFYQIEEESEQKKTNYYAYELQSNFSQWSLRKEEQVIKDKKSLRQYVKQVDFNNQKYILFEYIEGETLETKIKKHRGLNESINFDIIKHYLIQILDTLYLLHQNYILGRVFSTKNIMDCQGQIIFMDYGFGPKIMNQALDIMAPPEIINMLREERTPLMYDMKIDSWLLGAVLYHLVKLSPINGRVENDRYKQMYYKDLHEYSNHLQIQMAKSDHINAQTDRYPKEFCYFIQGLLTYDVNKRFSFTQIYKNQFINSLNLPKYQNYLRFYEQFNQQKMIEEINIIENHESIILSTQKLLIQGQKEPKNDEHIVAEFQEGTQSIQSKIPTLNLDMPSSRYSDSQISVQFPPTSQRLNQSERDDQDGIENYFPHQIQGLNESKFYQIWQFIRMELFRYTFLEKTAEDLIQQLYKKKFQLEHLLAYLLRKMGYLILIELLEKVNEDFCPWKCNNHQQDGWKNFQTDPQKIIFENDIKKKIQELETILKENFITNCQIYLKEEKIEQIVRDELEADSFCFQKQQNDGNSINIYKCRSGEFLKSGYRQFLQTTSKFVEREKKLGQKPEIQYNTILLKSVICYKINRIFNLSQISISFQGIMKNRSKKSDLISPNEIYQYICRDAKEEEKLEDINQIYKVHFQQA